MNKITIALLGGLLLMVAGCRWGGIRGNGHVVTDNRPVTDFSEIEADGGFQVEWRSGAPSFSITTDENLLRYITIENINQKLRIHSSGNLWPTHHITVAISSSTRTGARLTGAARLTAEQLSGRSFAIESTGAARVKLDGNVEDLVTDMTGASKLDAESLQTKTATISSTGASHADVNVSQALKVSITGAGKVSYSGTPTVEKHITGAGSISHKD